MLWFVILSFVIATGTYWRVALGGTRTPGIITEKEHTTSELFKDQLKKGVEAVKALKDFAHQFAKVVNKLKND